ncbi:hypothetical protein RJT34_29712 [Clitoria ternatea]|uniref:Uncharacterized protein n=1 Tax=Clitoria ternatea TaxID=43366 RepID=A0AAN9I6M8_CLITE
MFSSVYTPSFHLNSNDEWLNQSICLDFIVIMVIRFIRGSWGGDLATCSFRKLTNSFKYCISNLYNFNCEMLWTTHDHTSNKFKKYN